MKQIHWILLLLRKYSFNILVTTTSQNMLEKNNNKQTNNKQTNKKDLLRNLVNSQSISSYRTAEKCLFFCTDWLPFFGILTETKVLFFTCGIYSVCWWKKRIFTFTLVNNLSLAKLWATYTTLHQHPYYAQNVSQTAPENSWCVFTIVCTQAYLIHTDLIHVQVGLVVNCHTGVAIIIWTESCPRGVIFLEWVMVFLTSLEINESLQSWMKKKLLLKRKKCVWKVENKF